ncbi:MAG: hypothetical protein KGD63_07285 [Candidatus Lokiarchaeota archaeon]|nr:hypothetical protein [Candidatus Lokiarchaeota archaeon]
MSWFSILEREDYSDYLENIQIIRNSIYDINNLTDDEEKRNEINNIINTSIDYSNQMVGIGDFFEAGELLYSVAELLEDISYTKTLDLYREVISFWENQINSYQMQGKIHEISELYLRIAEIYGEKYKEFNLEKEYILKCIKCLKQESKLLGEFKEGRKLAQNYQNIAELYFKLSHYKKAIKYFKRVIEFAKIYKFYDILSYSYKQVSLSYEELDDYRNSKDILLDAIDFFMGLYEELKEKNDNLAIAQISQIIKNLHQQLENPKQYIFYSKREASSYINLAENLKKDDKNFYKIARYYRGAALCYKEIEQNLLESASCFVLAGNYCKRIKDNNQTAINYFDAAKIFKKLNNYELAYKHFMKSGDNFWEIKSYNRSTESYLNAYDVAMEGNLEFNRFGLFNQIVRCLNIIAEHDLQNKQYYAAATLILESIKFYEQLDTAKDFLLREMIKNTYKYYYRAANTKKINNSHIVHSYIIASLSLIIIGKLNKAKKIISEIDSKGKTIELFKQMINIIVDKVSNNEKIEIKDFPFHMSRLIDSSDDIKYLINLFKRL